jgi:DNA-binding MarR family transcriptional regulator
MGTRRRTGTRAAKRPAGKEAKARDDAAFRAALARAKEASTLELLFRTARLVDEEALRRVAALPGRPRLRRSHTALLPHIDLEGTRLGDLAERLGVSKQAVSQLVDDLEAVEMVARVPDPDDARAKRVVFTDAGRAGLLDGLAVLRALEGELAGVVGERELRRLRATLAAILAHVGR